MSISKRRRAAAALARFLNPVDERDREIREEAGERGNGQPAYLPMPRHSGISARLRRRRRMTTPIAVARARPKPTGGIHRGIRTSPSNTGSRKSMPKTNMAAINATSESLASLVIESSRSLRFLNLLMPHKPAAAPDEAGCQVRVRYVPDTICACVVRRCMKRFHGCDLAPRGRFVNARTRWLVTGTCPSPRPACPEILSR